jgi:hypothetical protein
MGVFMCIDHRLILSPCEIHRHARVTMIHSSKGVLKISPKWMLNLVNYVTSSCFSCLTHSLTFDHVRSFRSSLRSGSAGFPCGPPWLRLNDILFFSARTVVGGVFLRGGPASSLPGTHLHEVARLYLDKR